MLRPILVIALLGVALSGAAEAQKLYRWTDKDGNVHYSDHVPPEAVENARDEFNSSGMKVGEVGRALTPEELEAEKLRQKDEAARQKVIQEQENMDNILLSSYGNVGELERAYAERFDLINQSIESAKVGIQSQEKSLAELLEHAAGLERQNKPIPASIKASLELAKSQVAQQRTYLKKRESERTALQAEFDATKSRYLMLRAKNDAEAGATRSH